MLEKETFSLKHQTRKLRSKEILEGYQMLKNFCYERKIEETHLALSFVMSNQFVLEIILGCANVTQLKNLLEFIKNLLMKVTLALLKV